MGPGGALAPEREGINSPFPREGGEGIGNTPIRHNVGLTARSASTNTDHLHQPRAAGGTTRTRPPIWTRAYLLTCATGFLAYAHEGLLTPTLPLYISSLGGTELLVGLILATFSVTSFLVRPLLGYLADNWTVVGVLLLGSFLLALAGFGLLVPVFAALAVANALRGIGWAAVNTGGNTLLAHVAPPARRLESATYLGLFQNGAITFAPVLALWLIDLPELGTPSVLVLSGLAGLAALAVGSPLLRTSLHSTTRLASSLDPRAMFRGAFVFEPSVLLPAALVALITLTYPAAFSFATLYALQIGVSVGDVSWYFVVSGASTMLTRVIYGPVADRLGHGRSLVLGLVLALLGLVTLALATNLPMLLLGGVVYSSAPSIVTSVTTALAIDRSDPGRRGVAMASYSMAFQVGMGFGAAIWGTIIELAGYRQMYASTLVAILVALALTIRHWPSLRRQPAP